MTRFSDQGVTYLRERNLGRLATAATSGKPHVAPIRFHRDPEQEVIRIGRRILEGPARSASTLRHLKAKPQTALVVDDTPDAQTWQPRGILIKGTTVLHTEGGEALGPGFSPNWVVVPDFVTPWGIEALAIRSAEG
ncbi:pyridoxamine 5'-phosphate oxidase family protein [Streptomyces sp. BK205]|uniref:pyridoxamine 5'-phosphate oxidase family protein n=1 Tax=Streptomyces sp. BK205 TaxID=2512164 RepID=UPI0010F202E8|nr:pyridoxamine 5'-phosphate oxidase family protein [Streptomyces sp. BK205]TCR19539.1 PPOX class F420-dependent enzyme/OxyR family protein [Streptomyces sp. BK205]